MNLNRRGFLRSLGVAFAVAVLPPVFPLISKGDDFDHFEIASPDTVGAFPIRSDITVLPADDPRKLRLGWIFYEEVGIVIINDVGITKIEI